MSANIPKIIEDAVEEYEDIVKVTGKIPSKKYFENTLTQIHTQAKEEEVKLDTLKWVRARLGDEFNDNFHYKGSDFKDYIDLLSNNKK